MSAPFKVGIGYDIHRTIEGRPLYIGGLLIDAPFGLDGHSDADVLLHAIADALLGTISGRDIGYHFPPNDPQYEGYDSAQLLSEVVQMVHEKGFTIGNIDSVVIAERPKLLNYIEPIQLRIAQITQCDSVSVKATTNERLGDVGQEKGIAAQAVTLVYKSENK